ncbi:hypothetical protein FGO68_gene10866 [Halteria grandinella]|uniref:Uncharacterized protein n=1 Tax=Halteria grandinella TaxID=5974 RepID=A0A8J8SWN8_HALGN|nr:hypothetical protein FGO68_gene10866 [Halteria grandinella]
MNSLIFLINKMKKQNQTFIVNETRRATFKTFEEPKTKRIIISSEHGQTKYKKVMSFLDVDRSQKNQANIAGRI